MTVSAAHSLHNDDVSTVTSSDSRQRLPVILEPPLLHVSIGESRQSPALRHSPLAELHPSTSWNSTDQVDTGTGSGIVSAAAVESQLADEVATDQEEQEWSWRYDEHGKKIWYRKSVDVESLPEGHAVGTVRFATRPVDTATSTSSPMHGYWMIDDRGSYLWYRFVESGGQYIRDPDVERMDTQEHISPDERSSSRRDRLTWTGVGRSVLLRPVHTGNKVSVSGNNFLPKMATKLPVWTGLKCTVEFTLACTAAVAFSRFKRVFPCRDVHGFTFLVLNSTQYPTDTIQSTHGWTRRMYNLVSHAPASLTFFTRESDRLWSCHRYDNSGLPVLPVAVRP